MTENLAPESWAELLERLGEVHDLRAAGALGHWDQATGMPAGGASARGRQLATLTRLAHEKFTDARIGELLDKNANFAREEAQNGRDFAANVIRATRREWDRATRVPAEFEGRFAAHSAVCYETWTRARPANDFQMVRPFLEKTLDLSRELAAFFPFQHIADPLIDFSDPGFTVATTRALFADLRSQLVPLVEKVTTRGLADNAPLLLAPFPVEKQLEFARQAISALGYDWNRGRLDFSPHPFMTKFSTGDVRITVRGTENEVSDLLFGGLHETGHALYEQGIGQFYEGTAVAEGVSSGVHESQSRLWENQVGRSRAFWEHFFERFQTTFPQLQNTSLDAWMKAINRVEKTLVRTESDELTYNLHVIIRFDLECDLLDGTLEIKDLPAAWNARYQSDLGLLPPNDSDGCLQDVHWFGGAIGGAFQGYTLGNILAAQFFEAAQNQIGDLNTQFQRGEFAPLREWLRENVHKNGAAHLPFEVVKNATGKDLNLAPYLGYLKEKFGC